MMATTADDIKRLREETSCGVIDCKKALEEAKGSRQLYGGPHLS